MKNSEYRALTHALACGGAMLRAARRCPDGGYGVYPTATHPHLLITDPLLADKTLSAIEAGKDLPPQVTLGFDQSLDVARYLLIVAKHLQDDHSLALGHPLFRET